MTQYARFSRFVPLLFASSLLFAATGLRAAGIVRLYDEALSSDAQYAAARATLEAAQTLPGQTLGQMLPQVSMQASRSKNKTDWEHRSRHIHRDYDFMSSSASLNLSLALIRPQLWAEYARSKAEVRAAEADFTFAGQDLITRLGQAYFGVLLAEDTLRLAREQKMALAELLKLVKRHFEAGIGTITDINETQARFDTIVAQELAAENALEVRIRSLESMVGKTYRSLDRLGDRLVLEAPQPNDIERWVETALAGNPQVRSAEAGLEAAQRDVYRNRAAHLPTLDLVASRSLQRNPGYSTINEKTDTSAVWLQLSMPIFSGGTTQGRVNQSLALEEKAKSRLEYARRAITVGTREQFLNVVTGIARIKALEQAVKSNDLALYSARKGQEAGLRTSFDVLNAQQLLFAARRDLAQARYDYVLARLRLRGMVGLLGADDIALVQSWLDHPSLKANNSSLPESPAKRD